MAAAQADESGDVSYDLGNLACFVSLPVDEKALRKEGEAYLQRTATATATNLINKIFALPDAGRPKDGGRLVVLPECNTPLPREKPVPKPKAPTRWEAFAERKGIVKKKRSRMVLDEETDEYKPRYGYKSVDNDGVDDQFIEHKGNMDLSDGMDPFLQRAQEKKARVDLNKKQQIRNQRSALRNAMGTVGGTVEDPRNRKEKAQAEALYDVAKTATASVGKFDVVSKSQKANAPREKSKGAQKFAPVVGNKKAGVAEQQNNLKILGRMLGQEGSGDKVLNQTKAAKSVHDEVGAKDAASRREAKVVKKISKKMERKKMKKKK